ncbi:MAG: MFS transporter [Desulfobacteraceae bacterium]|uniref:MFS transporter n=1 Tax=Candidatus Desulfacyla euxinica TaxID=2841693 RepID=A0A8J6N0S6_9DELT|nr:MFS transporter [Candidatus Desulfacyla euxinica]MBL6979525.1 MFS transporter [Desulfobacteraceae bacterium]
MNPNERKILTTTCFGHFMSHFNMLMFPALVLPLMGMYDMDLSHVLALSFWMYLLFGVTALPWGLVSDRVGAKPLLLLFYTGAGLCGLAAGFFIDSPKAFSLCLAGIGIFSGIYHPAGLGLISRGISKMSMALGYNGMAGNAGLATAPILAGVINHFYGIQTAFIFLGCLNLTGTVIMLLLPVIEPERNEKTESQGSMRLMLSFAVLCICMMLGGVAYRSVTVILPAYLELGNPALLDWISRLPWMPASRNVAATALSSSVFMVGMFGQFLGGVTAERFEPRRGYLVFHVLALPMVLAMAYTTDVSLLLITMGYMLFLLGMQPIENTLVAKLTPDKVRDSAYGTKFILTFGVGAFAVYLVGWVKEVWSFPAVFVAMAIVSLTTVLSILLLMRVTRKISI